MWHFPRSLKGVRERVTPYATAGGKRLLCHRKSFSSLLLSGHFLSDVILSGALTTSCTPMTPKFVSPAQIFPNSGLVHPAVSGVPPLGWLNRCLLLNGSLPKFLTLPKPTLAFVSSLRKESSASFQLVESETWHHLLLSPPTADPPAMSWVT